MQYQCILGIDFMKESKLTLEFDQKSLIIPDDQIKQLPKVEKPVEIGLSDTKLGERQKQKLRNLFNGFKGLFSDQPGLTHVLSREIDTGDKGPVVSRSYRYDRVKQGIIDHHIKKMLQEGKIRPIQSPYASPVVLTRKNNDLPSDSPEAYRFAIDYRKLNAITKYPRHLLPVIKDLITNIPHTGVMSTLDLKSGYFQLAISPKDIEKTAFITRNGTFAFLRMPFGLSGVAPNFQKAIDIIFKPVIGRLVMVYMDGIIITSPSFNEHIDHLNQVFTLLRDAGLTLNKEKCHFARDKLKYLGLMISKEGIETDNSKVKAIEEMKPPKNNKEVSKILGMAGWDAFDKIKRALTEAPVLQLPSFKEHFNLFTDASGVGIGAVLNQNHIPIAFASRSLKKAERNYTVTERECLVVIWALNKFKTYFGSLPVKKRKRVTVNIDPVRVYRPRQSDTISSDSHVETLCEGQRSSNGSSRSYPGKFKASRKTSSEESKGRKSNKDNAGWEDSRLKRKVGPNGSVDRKDIKRSKICRKRSLQGSEHRDQKRPTPEPTQGIKRAIPSSVSSRNYKYRKPNNPSQGSQSIAGPSHQMDTRQGKPPTEGSRQEKVDNMTRPGKQGQLQAESTEQLRGDHSCLNM
ncbi:retrovirus-related Pol polyprotein from transposon 297 [Trichonephila clavipes]|nr:retrovirus-related Pol polyprotein from transposon 297 [Trichonephila clavipes]